jgi:DNA-directed RNA polymerase
MRTRGSRQQIEALKKASYPSDGSKKAPMQQVFEALNALGNVPWKINAPVAGVVEQVWKLCKEGEGLAGLPTREKALLPQKPEEEAAEDRTVWREYKRALQKVSG